MIPTLVTCALVVLVLAGCAIASMVLEGRSDARRLPRSAHHRFPGPDDASEPPEGAVEAAEPDIDLSDEPVESLVVIPGRVAADTAVAVLLGSYVASGGESARRAAAWVTEQLRRAADSGGTGGLHVRLAAAGEHDDPAAGVTSATSVDQTV